MTNIVKELAVIKKTKEITNDQGTELGKKSRNT